MNDSQEFAIFGLLTGFNLMKELERILAPLNMGVMTNLWINLYDKGRNEVRCHTEKVSSVRLTFPEQLATVAPALVSSPAGHVVTLYNVPNRMGALADQLNELLVSAIIENELSLKLNRVAINYQGQVELVLVNQLTKAKYTFVLSADQPLSELPALLGKHIQNLPRLTMLNQDDYMEEINDTLREKRSLLRIVRIAINGAFCTLYDNNGGTWDDLVVLQNPQGLTSELLDMLDECAIEDIRGKEEYKRYQDELSEEERQW